MSTSTDTPRETAHHLLRELATSLGHEGPLTHTPTGQPLIEGLHISLTHTTGVAAVTATHAGPVGIDAEVRRTFPVESLSRRWFAPTETTTSPEAFLHLWTAKEAVGKALTRGLRGSGLARLMPPEVTHQPTDGTCLTAHVVPSEPALAVVHLPLDVVLALAFPASVAEVVLHHGTALRSTVRSRTSFPVVVRGS
ncbi:4'-phosphopantetheinyl transferase family protein [Kribbella lupini]|uniref:4'-phosphopantetheinyl transferase family protein n=1 Tax=Kribbella lupini TaxID=291602 RepID=UPI003CD0942E